MPVGWFIVPYRRRPMVRPVTRYCPVDDFTAQIITDGGSWSETEILGDSALVKVRASAATLTDLNAQPGFTRLPGAQLTDPLSSLTPGERAGLRDRLNGLGYPLQEISAAVGDLSAVTLGDVLRFAARRRLKPRFDLESGDVVLDGKVQPVRAVATVEAAVP